LNDNRANYFIPCYDKLLFVSHQNSEAFLFILFSLFLSQFPLDNFRSGNPYLSISTVEVKTEGEHKSKYLRHSCTNSRRHVAPGN